MVTSIYSYIHIYLELIFNALASQYFELKIRLCLFYRIGYRFRLEKTFLSTTIESCLLIIISNLLHCVFLCTLSILRSFLSSSFYHMFLFPFFITRFISLLYCMFLSPLLTSIRVFMNFLYYVFYVLSSLSVFYVLSLFSFYVSSFPSFSKCFSFLSLLRFSSPLYTTRVISPAVVNFTN